MRRRKSYRWPLAIWMRSMSASLVYLASAAITDSSGGSSKASATRFKPVPPNHSDAVYRSRLYLNNFAPQTEGSDFVHGSADCELFPSKARKLFPFTSYVSASPVLIRAPKSVSKCLKRALAQSGSMRSAPLTIEPRSKGSSSSFSTIQSVLLESSERNTMRSSP